MAKSKHSVNGRDSYGQRLGVKAFGSQQVTAGSIIIRQKGTKFFPGKTSGWVLTILSTPG